MANYAKCVLQIPLCELETEKSQLEDTLLRALMMRSISKKMTGSGFDTDEYYKRAQADLLKSSMKLFEVNAITFNHLGDARIFAFASNAITDTFECIMEVAY